MLLLMTMTVVNNFTSEKQFTSTHSSNNSNQCGKLEVIVRCSNNGKRQNNVHLERAVLQLLLGILNKRHQKLTEITFTFATLVTEVNKIGQAFGDGGRSRSKEIRFDKYYYFVAQSLNRLMCLILQLSLRYGSSLLETRTQFSSNQH